MRFEQESLRARAKYLDPGPHEQYCHSSWFAYKTLYLHQLVEKNEKLRTTSQKESLHYALLEKAHFHITQASLC